MVLGWHPWVRQHLLVVCLALAQPDLLRTCNHANNFGNFVQLLLLHSAGKRAGVGVCRHHLRSRRAVAGRPIPLAGKVLFGRGMLLKCGLHLVSSGLLTHAVALQERLPSKPRH